MGKCQDLGGTRREIIHVLAMGAMKELQPQGVHTLGKLHCGGFYTNEQGKC